MLLSDMGNWADDRLDEGCRVSSVASLEMAAGLSALSGMDILAQRALRLSAMDHSRHNGCSSPGRLDDVQRRIAAARTETAVSTQKHTEIMFRAVGASCYPRPPMGAKGVVANTSHRPN